MSAEPCEHTETWFDRTICPEPCGSMHDVCIDCGEIVDGCILPVLYAEARAAQLAEAREAMSSTLASMLVTRQFRSTDQVVDALLALPEVRALIGGEQP